MLHLFSVVVPALLFSSLAQAQAIVDKSTVGPLTALSTKSKICSVLDYGGVADNATDVGPAILKAFSECASTGGATIYIPPGSYSLATGVNLNKGSAYALQIDGLITLTSDGVFGGNAIVIQNTKDVEVFSSNGLGAINGQGYITRLTSSSQNARLFRFISSSNIAIHDMIFVDSPTFHLVFNSVSNMEAYHITVRGPDTGGTDGIDVICTDNCYMHDIEVTNRDECISVKSPSQNILIEEVYCNQSGGMSIGSLTADGVASDSDAAAVSNITMRDIYVYQSTQMLMIKTFPGGSGATGFVKDSLFENFWAYDTTYALDIDQYWYNHNTPNTGAVAISSLQFQNWTGTVNNGVSRGPIVIRGSDIVPLTDITLTNIDMWTVEGSKIVNQCKNVYGSGYCAQSSSGASLTAFTISQTTTTPPAAFTSPTSPAWGVAGYGSTIPIPVYTPAVMWGAAASASSGAVSSPTSSSVLKTASSQAKVTSPPSSSSAKIAVADITSSLPTSSSLPEYAPLTGALLSVSSGSISSTQIPISSTQVPISSSASIAEASTIPEFVPVTGSLLSVSSGSISSTKISSTQVISSAQATNAEASSIAEYTPVSASLLPVVPTTITSRTVPFNTATATQSSADVGQSSIAEYVPPSGTLLPVVPTTITSRTVPLNTGTAPAVQPSSTIPAESSGSDIPEFTPIGSGSLLPVVPTTITSRTVPVPTSFATSASVVRSSVVGVPIASSVVVPSFATVITSDAPRFTLPAQGQATPVVTITASVPSLAQASTVPELLAAIDQLLGLAGGSLEGVVGGGERDGPSAEHAGGRGKGKNGKMGKKA